MKERLRRVGIIHPHVPKLCFGDSQESVFKAALHLVRYDHPTAHFIALKSSDPQVRRLKVQVAILIVLTKDWAIETHGSSVFSARGWGVFDYVRNWGGLWQGLVSDTSLVCGIDNNLSVPAQGAFIFRQMTKAFETILNGVTEYPEVHLPPHRIVHEAGDLDNHQMKQLLRHLLCAYIYQVTKSHLAIDD
ncbi:uncharacterized protein BKA55DRAFT_698027 [Fusarium redolens]|uniref:Uncharacterized protein n=1 Tax=Fusarium redolens TaxID=48865 RepID=A0A9P9JQI2_FUSRE|nr:uncharacterized protein BKA55DRAFT_698027 [Fusarium redolens]KAH7210898.1 hypothetical protein BKA55DRAFT_698027 [Fusarium redolens]